MPDPLPRPRATPHKNEPVITARDPWVMAVDAALMDALARIEQLEADKADIELRLDAIELALNIPPV